MNRIRRIRSTVFFMAIILAKVLHEGKQEYAYIAVATAINLVCLAVQIYFSNNNFTEATQINGKMIIKLLPIIILCFQDTVLSKQNLDCLRALQYMLLGQELGLLFRKRKKWYKRQNMGIWTVIIGLSTIACFNLGLYTEYSKKPLEWIQPTFIILIWGLDIISVVYEQFRKRDVLSPDQATLKRKMITKRQEGKIELVDKKDFEKAPSKGTIKKLQQSQTQAFYSKRNHTIARNDLDIYRLTRNIKGNGPLVMDQQSFYHESASQKVSNYGPNSFQEVMANQKNFYQMLFNQFPDGMIIITEDQKVDYCNNCMRKLLGTMTRPDTLKKLLELRNCQKKFEEQARFQKLFKALNQKLNRQDSQDSFIRLEQGISPRIKVVDQVVDDSRSLMEEEGLNNSFNEQEEFNINTFISESETVLDEYMKGIKQLQQIMINNSQMVNNNSQMNNNVQQFSSSQNGSMHNLASQRRPSHAGSPQLSIKSGKPGQEKIRFHYEVKMLCYENEELECDESDRMGEGSDIQKQRSKLLEVTLKPYIFEQKPYVFIMVRDVTLFNQYSVLQQMNQNKSKMLYQVAHEFRTPLSCIILQTEALLEKFSDDRELCQIYFQPVLISASSLLCLVNDLLDLAQLKAGKFKLSIQEFDLLQSLYTVAQVLAPSVSMNGLELKMIADRKVPAIIKSDPNRLRQVVTNLISNAIKFTKHGSITLEAKCKDKHVVQISVSDTGVGIAKEDQPNLFRAFGKIEATAKDNPQGVGLGLMISHILAQKLSQRANSQEDLIGDGLQLISEGKGHGCTFQFDVYTNRDDFNDGSISSIFNGIKTSPHNMNQDDKQQAMARSLMDYNKPGDSNISILHLDHKVEQNSSSSRVVGNSCRVGVHSSQMLLTEGKIVFTFHISQQEKQAKSPTYPSNRNFLEVRQTKKTRILSVNLGYGDTQLIQIDTQQFEDRKSFVIPKVVGEVDPDFSPKDLGSKLDPFAKEKRYHFHVCNCPEILIVDDEMFNINALLLTFKKFSLKIVYVIDPQYIYKALNCEDAIALLQGLRASTCCRWIKLVLMDIEMVGRNGMQTTKDIRKLETTLLETDRTLQRAYVIGLSGHGMLHKKQCLDSGMDEYLTKPLQTQQFITLLTGLIRQHSSRTII